MWETRAQWPFLRNFIQQRLYNYTQQFIVDNLYIYIQLTAQLNGYLT